MAVVGFVILAARWSLMGSSAPVFQVVDNPHSFVNGSIYRVCHCHAISCLLLTLESDLCSKYIRSGTMSSKCRFHMQWLKSLKLTSKCNC